MKCQITHTDSANPVARINFIAQSVLKYGLIGVSIDTKEKWLETDISSGDEVSVIFWKEDDTAVRQITRVTLIPETPEEVEAFRDCSPVILSQRYGAFIALVPHPSTAGELGTFLYNNP